MMQGKTDFSLLWSIFLVFFRISPVTFGGGYAMIPLLEKEVTERNQWISKEDIADVLSIAQTIPGSVAVNTATFIGFKLAGIPGALAATIGVITPTCTIIAIIAALFLGFQHLPIVQAAFLGIRPAVVALIIYAAVKIGKTAILDKITLILVLVSLAILLFLPIHPIFVILLGGVFGIVWGMIKKAAQVKSVHKGR